MTLDALVSQLRAAHGDALLGVVLYGSTVTDAAVKRGHNVLVVVRTLDVTAMRADGAIGLAWEEAGNAIPLTLTEAEWRSSVDVFAIEHADIADRHRVLHAAPGFAVTPVGSVHTADIRRQIEYELLAQVLGVRAAITHAGSDAKAQRALLSAHSSRAVAMMRGALRIAGQPPAADAVESISAAATLAGFDSAPFIAAYRQRHSGGDVPKADLPAVLSGFHAGLSTLLAYIDRVGKTQAH